ncbi:MAG: hypothetical protein Q7J45_01870 [bacterium]|nr:hypothetical protein [bacterium]
MKEKPPMSAYDLLVLALIVGNLFFYTTLFAPTKLRVAVLDVGKEGRVVLIKSPGGSVVLVNAGPDASILRALGTEMPPWQRKIDAVLFTETSVTAAAGLPAALERYQIGVLIRPAAQGTRSTEALIRAVGTKHNLKQVIMGPRMSLDLGDKTSISTPSPGGIVISYKKTVLRITKNTPSGAFSSDGETLERVTPY